MRTRGKKQKTKWGNMAVNQSREKEKMRRERKTHAKKDRKS